MPLADRMHDAVDSWASSWADRLKSWISGVLAWGLEILLDVLGKSFAPKLGPLIASMEASGKVPPELKPLLDELKAPTGQVAAMLGSSAGYAVVGGAVGKIMDALLLPMAYWINEQTRHVTLTPTQATLALFRGRLTQEQFSNLMHWAGIADNYADDLVGITRPLLSEDTLRQLRIRGEITAGEYSAMMAMIGWTSSHVELVKKLHDIIPPLADMVRFADFGSFDPAVIAMWREYYDAPGWITEPMSKLGVTGEWANRYWFSHWRQPGRYELGEMHRRNLISDEIVKNAYLTQGFSRFWQDNLLRLVEEPLTRVDIRRMHKIGLLTDEELAEAYQAVGFYGVNNARMVAFTKAYNAGEDRDLTKTDILSAYRKGEIDEPLARELLAEIDFGPDEIDFYLSKELQAETTRQRDLTLSNWRQLYQLGIIEKSAATAALAELGYDQEEIAHLFALWEVEAPPRVAKPSRTDLEHWLKANIISLETWRREMASLGYSEKYIGWYHQEITSEMKEE